MMLASLKPTIIIDSNFIGYDVEVVPAVDGSYAYTSDDRASAEHYAAALSYVTGWSVLDQSRPAIGDERIGRCLIGDITYNGDDQPTIHNDEQLDLEEYEPNIDEYEESEA